METIMTTPQGTNTICNLFCNVPDRFARKIGANSKIRYGGCVGGIVTYEIDGMIKEVNLSRGSNCENSALANYLDS